MGRRPPNIKALMPDVKVWLEEFPMIPPQVNGATKTHPSGESQSSDQFPMIPPQVNGATGTDENGDEYGNCRFQ